LHLPTRRSERGLLYFQHGLLASPLLTSKDTKDCQRHVILGLDTAHEAGEFIKDAREERGSREIAMFGKNRHKSRSAKRPELHSSFSPSSYPLSVSLLLHKQKGF
jgi:hypothetical protein